MQFRSCKILYVHVQKHSHTSSHKESLTMASSMSRQFYLHTSLAAVSRTRSRAANNHARWSCDSTRPCPTCCHVPALVWRRIARQRGGRSCPKVCLDERHTPPNLGCWSYERDSQLLYALCKNCTISLSC